MGISISTQSKKELAPVYIRIRQGKIDTKARTKFLINPKKLVNGKIKNYPIPKGANAETKRDIKVKNRILNETREHLNKMVDSLTMHLNNVNDYEVIDSKWIYNIIDPPKDTTPVFLTEYFDFYWKNKKNDIRPSTVKKMKSIQSRLIEFEKTQKGKVYISNVNNSFRKSFSEWSDKSGYAHNTKLQTLKIAKTICTHAKQNGVIVHPELDYLMKGLKYKETPHVYLTFKELDIIEGLSLSGSLDNARDWLIISCYTAQRVSDFLKFSKDDIVVLDGNYFLDINQQKTLAPIYVHLPDNVLKILEKHDGNFPPIFSQNKDSNEVTYNLLIKEVCQKAEIDEIVTANLRQTKTNRYKIVEVPKYKAVSSHIGRRSFATNYYGKINTALLISATGHATEKQFLTYVGKKPQSNAIELAKEIRRFTIEQGKKPSFEVIKNVKNG